MRAAADGVDDIRQTRDDGGMAGALCARAIRMELAVTQLPAGAGPTPAHEASVLPQGTDGVALRVAELSGVGQTPGAHDGFAERLARLGAGNHGIDAADFACIEEPACIPNRERQVPGTSQCSQDWLRTFHFAVPRFDAPRVCAVELEPFYVRKTFQPPRGPQCPACRALSIQRDVEKGAPAEDVSRRRHGTSCAALGSNPDAAREFL